MEIISDIMNNRYSKLLSQAVLVIIAFSMIIISSQVSSVSAAKFEYDPFEVIRRTILDHDGNLIIVGETSNEDIALVKMDTNGTIIWDQVFGGAETEVANDLIIDKNNNIYLLGLTASSNFPVTENAFQKQYGGSDDFFVRIVNSEGKVILSSYWGGSQIEQIDPWTNTLAITSDNKLIMVGETKSLDIEMKRAFQSEYITKEGGLGLRGNIMIAKISSDGTLDWSSYFGASGDLYIQLKLDTDDNIILYGEVQGLGLPGVEDDQFQFHGMRDELVSKISPNGEIIFTKYLGGSDEERSGIIVEIDSQNNIITYGLTSSNDYDTTDNVIQPNYGGGERDVFINKISPNGDIVWSTYFGGNGNDYLGTCCGPSNDDNQFTEVNLLLVDSNDDIVFSVIGSSTDLPLINAFDNYTTGIKERYLGKISSDGSSLIFGAYHEGAVADVLIDQNNDIIVTGHTISAQHLTTANAAQPNFGGSRDVYYLKLHSNGSVIFISYLGGSDQDRVVEGILTDNGKLLIIGTTESIDLPFAINSYGGNQDIFICSINQIGSVEFCQYIGGEGLDQINRAGILVDEFGNMILIGITRSQELDLSNPPLSDYEQAALITQLDSEGNVLWKNLYIPGEPIPSDPPDNTLLYVIIGSIFAALALGSFYVRSLYIKSKTLDNHLLNANMSKILAPIFNTQPQLIHIFGATKVFKENKDLDEIQSELPRAILDFKYFLHPVRLSIIKLLDENINLTTVKLKDFLGISWNEILFHIDSLKKTEYITVNQQFIDGTTKTIVSAEAKLISQYNALKDVLFEFLDGSPNLERYLDQVTEIKMRAEDPDLYPDKH